ncbi:cell division protein FtsQ/DivIB [Enterococcus sp. LJL51]|uniref:cell division protein FtsQ/DivIB n=1 Tax=Enterococcus sp. LJL51 TaxID=3416656 RepID=UPI003CEB4ACC
MKSQGESPVWHPENRKPSEEEEIEEQNETEEKVEEEVSTESVEPEESTPSYESFADRLPNVKKVRNTRLIRRLTLIISIAAAAILILVYFISPLSKLSSVSVTGNKDTKTEDILADSKLIQGESLWEQYWNRSVNEKNIEKTLPRVKRASVTLNGINSFKISIEEYEVMALESLEGSYHPILENGKVLPDKLESPVSGMPVFENFSDEELIRELMESYNQLPNELKEAISEIKYAPSDSNKELVRIYMKDNNEVIVNISQLTEKMKYYTQVASQMEEPGVIDMEVGIFSYPHGNENKTNQTTESTVEDSEIPLEGY